MQTRQKNTIQQLWIQLQQNDLIHARALRRLETARRLGNSRARVRCLAVKVRHAEVTVPVVIIVIGVVAVGVSCCCRSQFLDLKERLGEEWSDLVDLHQPDVIHL